MNARARINSFPLPSSFLADPERDVLALMHAAEKIDAGHWLMQCPVHAGASAATLEVWLSEGRYTLRCIAGCPPASILRAALVRLENCTGDSRG